MAGGGRIESVCNREKNCQVKPETSVLSTAACATMTPTESTLTPAMSQPPNANPPFANTEEAARDAESAVDFILKRRGLAKLNLIGWSWGTTTNALYTTRHNDRINKRALYAPLWTPPSAGKPSPAAQGLCRSLKNTPYKSYIEVGEGTHMLMLEKNRMQLFRAVQAFLDDPAA